MQVWEKIKNAKSLFDLIKDLFDGYDPMPSVSFPSGNVPVADMKYLHPKVRKAALAAIEECSQNGHAVRVTETYRTPQRQDALYAQGRTSPGLVVTKAQAGESYHNYGLALDITPVNDDVGVIFEKHGFEWGARWKSFKDTPHFQMTFGYKIGAIKQIYDDAEGDIIKVWNKIST
jgi:hypothetical protein